MYNREMSVLSIKDVRIFTGQTVYQSGIDYIVDRGVIQRTENSSIVAGGTVTIEYTEDTPPEALTSKKLLNELGRRTVDEVLFCGFLSEARSFPQLGAAPGGGGGSAAEPCVACARALIGVYKTAKH